jgi:hypothetical protein
MQVGEVLENDNPVTLTTNHIDVVDESIPMVTMIGPTIMNAELRLRKAPGLRDGDRKIATTKNPSIVVAAAGKMMMTAIS